jgi:FlaA1/EpsC-like NDP-sugar epimerase
MQQKEVLGWPRTMKRMIVSGADLLMSLAATWLAFSLRLDQLHRPAGAEWWVYILCPLLALPIFIRFGLYRAIFRYTGRAAFVAMTRAVAVYGFVLLAALMLLQWPNVPRSLGVLQPLLFLLMIGSSRAIARFWLTSLGHTSKTASRLLIFGAGTAGVQTAMGIDVSGQYSLLGFVDDDPGKIGRDLNGLPVFAPTQVPSLVLYQGVTDILLALPSASRERRNAIVESLRALPVHVRSLPGLADLASGRVTVRDFRELDVDDLLGRDPVMPDAELLARDLTGKVVMVSGAGGSIGGELCRQILLRLPSQLVLLDHNEFGLYSIHQELLALCSIKGLSVELVPMLGSVSNYQRMFAVCKRYRPNSIYHAAAYKHVPMVESNASEGIANNVFGTLHLARAAIENSVSRFVLISTDKAVRPTNLMGASKRMAELVLQALAAEAAPLFRTADAPEGPVANRTCFTMVRFGNVLDSSGSVVPLFRKQIAAGGPLTVTHAEVTRYFMLMPEAAQLVLQAGAMAGGGDVFVLDMGAPLKIMDMARRMVELSGLKLRSPASPQGDIDIQITGLRPGEKLYEELLIGDNPEPTAHPRIMKAHEPFVPWPQLALELKELGLAVSQDDLASVNRMLQRLVQGYSPAIS